MHYRHLFGSEGHGRPGRIDYNAHRGGHGGPHGDRGRHHAGRSGGFGRGGLGGRGGGGGRIFGPGDLRLMLLELLAAKPSHGYELIRSIEERVGGGYSPSPGSVYPTLTLLEELGHIRAATADGAKKLFEVTAEGREFLAQNRAHIDGITARMGLVARALEGRGPSEAVHQAMHTLKAALMMHGQWSDSESNRVRGILEQAAVEISKQPGRE